MVSLSVWREVLREGEEKLISARRLKERELESSLSKELSLKEIATVLLGVRRAGKSSIALRLGRERSSAYINFEDYRLLSADEKDLSKIASLVKGYDLVIFDEVQNLPGWEKLVYKLLGTQKVIVTGSNATLLKGHFSSALVGRKRAHTVMPFSYSEYKKYTEKGLLAYIEEGGFPYPTLNNTPELSLEYAEDIFFRDIAPRIRNYKKAEKVYFYVMENPGIVATMKKVKSLVSLSTKTLESYLDTFVDAYTLIEVERKKAIYRYRKFYPIDNGFSRGALARKAEALIAQELIRRGKKLSYMSGQAWEIDFIVGKTAIQVCYELNEDNLEREISPLKKWKGKRILVCVDGWQYFEERGIEIISFEEFLNKGYKKLN